MKKRDGKSGQFQSGLPETTEDRMLRLGVDCYELAVLRLVIRKEYHPDFAVKVVERLHGVKVDIRALHAKLVADAHVLLPMNDLP
jgi:hypothetical protein